MNVSLLRTPIARHPGLACLVAFASVALNPCPTTVSAAPLLSPATSVPAPHPQGDPGSGFDLTGAGSGGAPAGGASGVCCWTGGWVAAVAPPPVVSALSR